MLERWVVESLKTALFWPAWWYTYGLAKVARSVLIALQTFGKTLNVKVWFKNLFVPMYGMRDWQSRVISFGVRAMQIVVRSFALLIWSAILFCGLILYVLTPPALLTLIVMQFLYA